MELLSTCNDVDVEVQDSVARRMMFLLGRRVVRLSAGLQVSGLGRENFEKKST